MLKNLETPGEKAIRRLVTLAHERGLKPHLERLEAAFAGWRAGEVSTLALTDRITTFHDGAARSLAKQFIPSNSMTALGHAVTTGLVSESEVPPELKEELAVVVALLRFKK